MTQVLISQTDCFYEDIVFIYDKKMCNRMIHRNKY